MAYGIETTNNSGRTLIDQNSRQVQIVKSGSLVPGALGVYNSTYNPFRTGPTASGIVLPGNRATSLVFAKPRRVSGSTATSNHFAVHFGTCNITWTCTTAAALNTNYIYASYSKSNAVIENLSSSYLPIAVNTTTVNDQPTVDTVGGSVGAYGNWASGSSAAINIIRDIETTGTSGVYKLILSNTWTTSSRPGVGSVARVIERDIVFFTRVQKYAYNSAWTLDYKLGFLSNKSEESAGYGFEVYKSDGSLAFSSNRVNFQIESITSGNAAPIAASGTGNFVNTLPFFGVEVDFPSDWADYWVLATAAGSSGAFINGGIPRAAGFSNGYYFSMPGYSGYDNATGAQLYSGSSSSKSTSSAHGIGMSPVLHTRYNTAPAINAYAKVSDTWAPEAPSSLIIGKFV